MSATTLKDQIQETLTLEVLRPTHVESAVECIAETFALGEPMSQALGIGSAEFRDFARLFIRQAAQAGLSVVAVNDDQRVVGATIAEDYATEPPPGIENISEKFTPIFSLLEALVERYTHRHPVVPGSHYHIFMCGVYQRYAHRCLGQRLTNFATDIARERKYRTMVCEATGPASQFILAKKLGFTADEAISYADFQLDGQAVFAGITTVKSCVIYQKAV